MSFRFSAERGLFLPAAFDPGVAVAMASGYTHVTIGWKDIHPDDEPTTLDVLTRLAAQLSSEGILYMVSIRQLVMRRRFGGDRAAYLREQLLVAKELFPSDTYERVRLRADTTDGDTVIHPTQLLVTALLAIHFGKPGDRTAPWDTAIGAELLLRILDALDITGGQGGDSLLQLLIRRYGENRSEQERYLLGRYFDLFVQRPRAKWGSPSPFDQLFERSKGYSMDELLACGYPLVRELLTVPSVAALNQLRFDEAVSRTARQVGHVPHAQLVEHDLVGTLEWFRAHQQTRLNARSLALTNLEAFGEKPLVRVPSGGVLPLSMPLFLQRLSIGLYWELFEAACAADPVHGVVDLNAKVGDIFQEYCTSALRTAAVAAGGTFVAEAEVIGPGERSKPDALLLEGRSLVVIEMTVTTLPMAVLVKGNVQAFRRLLAPNGALGRKLRQPITATGNLLDGTISTPGVDPSQIDAIFPVVLFLHPLPQHALVAREIAAAYTPPTVLYAAGRPDVQVHPVQFLSAEELEVLEPMIARGTQLSDLIRGKLASDPFLAGGPMKNYLFAQPGWQEIDNPRMRTLLDDLGLVCARVLGDRSA
ncbi:MAG TPA: hypothetical protein VMV92_40755 [Streptosporangiaceae bacterium]|nr:hypothetical protein [Streptosporangiaceae bacterium]